MVNDHGNVLPVSDNPDKHDAGWPDSAASLIDRDMRDRLLYEFLLVIAIAAALAAAGYLLRPRVLPFVPPPDPPVSDTGEDKLFKAISLETAREMFADKTALFADARPLIAYEEGHIEGALHLDPYTFDQWADTLIAAISPDQPIITYCEGPNCALSHELAEKLTWLGFERVYYLVDGWGKWKANGLPVDKTPETLD